MISRVKPQKNPLIFVIDDDLEIQNLLRKLFQLENYLVETFSTAVEAMKSLERQERTGAIECQLILCDLKLPDMDGLEFISRVNQRDWDIPVVFITAHGSVETAVEALKKGAFDYVIKPLNLSELRIITSRAIQFQDLKEDRKSLQKQLSEQQRKGDSLGQIIGKSKAIQQIFDLTRRVAKTNSNVLITGESGTGKEMVARAIHQNSPRKTESFVAINCSAIPDQLLESELFGHKKGAFTGAHENHSGLFEEAQGGTLFLDEIGDMPLGLQAKLLRVLQERKIRPVGDNQLKDIDVRIIAATHKNIRALIQEGKFREDLYYRLCVIPIQIPALRERKEDIPLIADHFLKKFCDLNRTPLKKLTKSALSHLLRLPWPGNVRELENLLERAVVLSDQEWIEEENLQIETEEKFERPSVSPLFAQLVTLEELEQSYIRYVLEVTHYSKEKASEILGINRKTLYRKEQEYQLSQKLSE
jgi:DNA-binding NtrC family response regulator